MSTAISDEPRLATVSDCLDEFDKCVHWERDHQRDYDEWMKENPDANAHAMLAMVDYWRSRRLRVEARLKQLSHQSQT